MMGAGKGNPCIGKDGPHGIIKICFRNMNLVFGSEVALLGFWEYMFQILFRVYVLVLLRFLLCPWPYGLGVGVDDSQPKRGTTGRNPHWSSSFQWAYDRKNSGMVGKFLPCE
jgi:hypothetical protein